MAKRPKSSPLDELMFRGQHFAEWAMRKDGRVHPAMMALSPQGLIHFVPNNLADVQAKINFANGCRLICAAYDVSAAVLVLESWMKVGKPGEAVDLTEAPSEAFDRREVILLLGEAVGQTRQKFLPIIRSDNGNFFGFGEYDGGSFTGFQGRFAQILPPKKLNAKGRMLARVMLQMLGVTEKSLRGGPRAN